MAERLCKTCRWWTDDPLTFDGKNQSLSILQVCNCPAIHDVSKMRKFTDLPNDAAGITDMEAMASKFGTGPEFGCIHWEVKNAS